MRIISKQNGLIVMVDGRKYVFEDKPIDVDEEDAKKILLNQTFEEVKEKGKKEG
ncbi:MAG: hypothetical protein N3F05_05055 [Candidatus Diapherotrites archaeon]|nr:hypothetical protein [Candidatus Diapherotrites archaeon]